MTMSSEKGSENQQQKWWMKLPRPAYSKLRRLEVKETWYEVYVVEPQTIAIYEPGQFDEAISYIISGEDRAILLDTGMGIANIKRTVSELTDLPIEVVNSHTHYDHVGGNHLFDTVSVFDNLVEIERLKRGFPHAELAKHLNEDLVWKPFPKDFDPESYEIPPSTPTRLLNNGDRVNLGGRELEVIHTPGHSPGCICLLDSKKRLLFTGDTFFPGPLYAHFPESDFDTYHDTVERMTELVPLVDALCPAHNEPWVKSDVLFKVAGAFRSVKSGKAHHVIDEGLKRYNFEGFGIYLRPDQEI